MVTVGIIIGALVVIFLLANFVGTGVLRIDRSNPNKDVYRFDVGNINSLSKKKLILLKVDRNADLTQK